MYICRHDGTGRKLISEPGETVTSATWIDDNTVGYLRVKEGFGGSYTRETYQVSVCTYNIKTGRRHELKNLNSAWPMEDFIQDRGQLKVDSTLFRFQSPVKVVSDRAQIEVSFGKEVSPQDEDSRFAEIKYNSLKARLDWVWNYESEPPSNIKVKLSFPGRQKFSVDILGSDLNWALVKENQLFLETSPGSSQHDRSTFVYRIDIEKKVAKLIVSNVGESSFRPSKELWLANDTNDNNLEPLDDGRNVNVDHLHCGNWKTGQRWKLTSGLVHVVSASLR